MLDYIPRSAALEAIEEERKAAHWAAQDMPCLGSCHDEYIVTRTLERVAMRLQSIPAVDVHDDVHGKWIHLSGCDLCSECRYSTGKHEQGREYCPHCGAKMDKEE